MIFTSFHLTTSIFYKFLKCKFSLDLQFSTDDEEFEEVETTEETVVTTLVQGENSQMATFSSDQSQLQLSSVPGGDDSQTAAEAMVQLSGIGFYTQSQGGDDSMDIDPNYDPSDFLSMANRNLGPSTSTPNSFAMPAVPQASQPTHYEQHEFTAPIEYKYDPHAMQFTPMHEPSYEYKPNFQPMAQQSQHFQLPQHHNLQYEQLAEEVTQGVMQYEEPPQVMYQEQAQMQHQQQQQMQAPPPMYMEQMPVMSNVKIEPQQPPQERPLHDDLAISDSDDEGQGMKMGVFKQEQPQEDDGEGLWF